MLYKIALWKCWVAVESGLSNKVTNYNGNPTQPNTEPLSFRENHLKMVCDHQPTGGNPFPNKSISCTKCTVNLKSPALKSVIYEMVRYSPSSTRSCHNIPQPSLIISHHLSVLWVHASGEEKIDDVLLLIQAISVINLAVGQDLHRQIT